MDKIISKSQAIRGTVWVFIFIIAVALWPLRLVQETVVSGSNRQISMTSEAITSEYTVMQMFVAQYDHLQNIKVYLLNESAGEEFYFILYDASMNILMNQVISTDGMEEMPGFCTIQVNQPTEVGREYYYLLQGISSDFYVAYEDTETSGTIYNGTLFYGYVEDTEHNIISEYDYKIPLRKGKTLVCDALLVLFGFLIHIFTKKYYAKYPERNRLLTVEMVWKRTATPIVVSAAVISMAAIWPLKLFSREIECILVFEAGVVFLAGILLYGIHREKHGKSRDMGLSVLRDRWTDYLQAVFYALAIHAGVYYMNGLYELHHTIAYREMLIYMALAVIATYKRKEILNPVNLVYLALAAVVGFFYYRNHVQGLVYEEEIRTVKLTVWAGIVSGIVIINTIFILLRKQSRQNICKSLNLWYGIVLAVFFALIIIFRNTRGWPIYLVSVFTLYYLRMAVWEKKERLLENLCNGILLHFLTMTGYCLLHRPFMFFIYTRYPFVFHTVTITAVYLTLVVSAAISKFLCIYRKTPELSYVWKELTIFGISTAYLIFTLSRTGYLAMIIMALIVIPTVFLGMRNGARALFKALAMMFIAFVLCFTTAFTAQRIIPSIVAQPETFEIEELPSEIVHGRDMDSKYYITVRRFIQLFENRILGIPEEQCIKSFDYAQAESNDDSGEIEILLASLEVSGSMFSEEEMEAQQEDGVEAYANGRIDHFKAYLQNLNMTGHDDMGVLLPDGSMSAHAHNIYLQAAYDHGIPVGIIFVIFGLCTLVQAALYYKNRKEDRPCSILPLALLVSFATAGLTEWVFHPCNPITFCLLTALAPLLVDAKENKRINVWD